MLRSCRKLLLIILPTIRHFLSWQIYTLFSDYNVKSFSLSSASVIFFCTIVARNSVCDPLTIGHTTWIKYLKNTFSSIFHARFGTTFLAFEGTYRSVLFACRHLACRILLKKISYTNTKSNINIFDHRPIQIRTIKTVGGWCVVKDERDHQYIQCQWCATLPPLTRSGQKELGTGSMFQEILCTFVTRSYEKSVIYWKWA